MTREFEPFENPFDEAEWKAQEAAQSESAEADPLTLDYRRLEQALLAMSRYEMTGDFARRTAAAVQKQDCVLDVFERRALIALSIAFSIMLALLAMLTIVSTRSTSLNSAVWLIVLVVCGLVLNATTPSAALRQRTSPVL